MNDDIKSLSHASWRCKYHIVFAPKYRRQEIYGDIRKDIGVILRMLCEHKKVEIQDLMEDDKPVMPMPIHSCSASPVT